MKKRKRSELLAEIDDLKQQISARNGHVVPAPPGVAAAPSTQSLGEIEAQLADVKAQLRLMSWLHAEFVQEAARAVAILAWLHVERAHHLEVFIESENRLIARARAVKAAQTQAATAAL